MAREMEGHIAGPMALKNFVETFLPLPNKKASITVSNALRTHMKNSMKMLAPCTNEDQLYAPLIAAMEPICPKFVPYDTHAKPLRNFDGMDIKPGICFYDKIHAEAKIRGISAVEMIAEVKYNLNDDAFLHIDYLEPIRDDIVRPEASLRPLTPTETDHAMFNETTILAVEAGHDESKFEEEGGREVDRDDDNDPGSPQFDSKRFQSDIHALSVQGRDTLAQITTYAVAQKAAQFRKHIFSLLLFKGYGRLLFWDFSGVVVTGRFSLTEDYFAEFLWRYNKANGSQRGHDETIRLLDAEEQASVSRLGLFKEDARLVVKIPVGQGPKEAFYVVEQQYFMGGISPFGRSTRGFIAYSLQEILNAENPESLPRKLFLKDTWRIVGRPQEHEFYDVLNEHNVNYIASYLQASDVPNQATIIQKICEAGALEPPKKIRRFQHYRLVLKEVGQDLTTFRSTKELVSIIYQALQAHQQAYDAGILHRDISVGNIMISENREALLVDWDMAKFNKDNFSGSKERAGTWQFLAARLLLNPGADVQQSFEDDLESFLYVLTYMVFGYTKVDYSPVSLYNVTNRIFNESSIDESGHEVGGTGKVVFLQGPADLNLANIKNPALSQLLYGIKNVIGARYPQATDCSLLPENLFLPEELCVGDATRNFSKEKALLEKPKWMQEFFKAALGFPAWPKNDAAKPNRIELPVHDMSSLKPSSAILNIAAEFGMNLKRSRVSL